MTTPASPSDHDFPFAEYFYYLTGNRPYPWQQNLFDRFAFSETIPSDINLPTGAGKTSIMAIWLLALACQARLNPHKVRLPRRLVWIVDRRVVVDQASDEARAIQDRLARCDPEGLRPVRDALAELSHNRGKEGVLAISTLRGEKEDNREWSGDPSRPAIIVGTVDMIGSRLLFSGYGDSRYWRPQHAGLLGNDALIVNDEAHLTRAMAELLNELERRRIGAVKPFKTIRLSATHPESACWPESLEEDRKDEVFRKTFEASKRLWICNVAAASFKTEMVKVAAEPGGRRTLVFVNSPERAKEIAAALAHRAGDANRVRTLTGTMRGYERDLLTSNDKTFKVFAAHVRPDEDYWLVATSAGEVGINISSDRLITELDTLDHLLQRFGRLNRFGETDGLAYVVGNEREKDERKIAALNFLRTKLPGNEDEGYDISPKALFGLTLDKDAVSEEPLLAPLHPWHIDVWSQTTLGWHPARPAPEPWLHGKQDNYAETYVAWRLDTEYLVNVDRGDLEDVFEKYRILAHEKLREPTYQLVGKLSEIFKANNDERKVIRRKRDGTVDVITLPRMGSGVDIRWDERAAVDELAYCELVLPPGIGMLRDGMFSAEWPTEEELASTPFDVSGTVRRDNESGATNEARAGFVAREEGEGWELERLGGFRDGDGARVSLRNRERGTLDQFAAERNWNLVLKVMPEVESGDEQQGRIALLYFGPAKQFQPSTKAPTVDRHSAQVTQVASELALALGLDVGLVNACEMAGIHHDLGKCEDIWQKAAGNWDYDKRQRIREPIAKPDGIMRARQLGGFRHEFASLLKASEQLRNDGLTPETLDLVLHLIAAHHGYARPCFESKAYDKKKLEASALAAMEVAQRFARLQRKWGPWGLAYLEAIFRAADGIASRSTREQPIHG